MVEMAAVLEETRRREFRRVLVVSAVAHALMVTAAMLVPEGRSSSQLPSVLHVSLVAAPSAAPAVAPAPAPAPAAKPRPAPPKAPVQTKVLPKEPSPVKPKPPPEATPKPRKDQSYEDVLANLRKEQGEMRPEPQTAAHTAPSATGGGPGVRVSPQVMAWLRQADLRVKQSWFLEPGFRLQPLETHIRVKVGADGSYVDGPEVVKRSGNPWYDDSVLRAMQKATPLPAPPEAGFEWNVIFRPEDLL